MIASPRPPTVSSRNGTGRWATPSACSRDAQNGWSAMTGTGTAGSPARSPAAVVPAPAWWTTAAVRGNGQSCGTMAVIVFAAAPLVSHIPLAALAGVLLATAVRMVEVGSLRAMTRATRSDAVILVLTAVATLVLDLVQAVIIGLAVAGVLALRAVARQARLAPLPLDRGDHTDEEHALLAQHIVAYRVDGPLFFAAAHRFLLELTELAEVRVVILRMSHVSVVDATGALVLKDAVTKLRRRGIVVMVSGVCPGHRRALDAVGVLDLLRHEGREYATTPQAIDAAHAHLQRDGVLRTAGSPARAPAPAGGTSSPATASLPAGETS